MLTSMKLSGATEDITAYHCREENYYFKQGKDLADELADKGIRAQTDEPLSYVLVRGKLCERLGYEEGARISEIDFNNLLNGRNRAGDKISREHKCHGIDLTFSAPKSASIAALLLGKSRIADIHLLAVEATMKEIERLAYGRLTSDTKDHTGKMIWAEVQDGYSREQDPHLHTHCVVMNLTEVGDKIVALDCRQILKRDFNQVFGAMYRQKFAERLCHDHGYDIEYTKNGEWRLKEVSRACEEAFSTRRRQILEAEAKGLRGMDAWRKTRKDKNNKANKGEILAEWRRRYREAERADSGKSRNHEPWRKDWAEKAVYNIEAEQEREGVRENTSAKKKWQLALRRATQNEATVTKETLLHQYICEQMRDEKWRSTTYERAMYELGEQVKQGNIIEVDGHYTSWEMVRAEREYLTAAVATADGAAVGLDWQAVAGWNEKSRRELSPAQSRAAEQIIGSREQVVVVQGDAGSGKTTALKAVADIYKSRGVPVIGVAMQGVAAQNLEKETGVRSYTLKTFFSPQKAKSAMPRVILFDEASMLDSRNAAKLFRIAKNNGDKIVLVGDRNQLESIASGRVFERLVEIKERKGELINLNENFRQRDSGLREAVDLARKGRMEESLGLLDKRGDVIEVENKFVKGENVSARRHETVAAQYDDKTLVVCSTQSARDELNLLIREKLKLEGRLSKEVEYNLARADADGIAESRKLKLAVGDKVTFTKNEYADYDVRNGERATVVRVGGILKPNALTVETEDKRKLEIDTKKYKHIDYGYALTTYKAQGQTFDKVVVDADTSSGPALNDMRNQYVNITRARDSVKIYTDDKETLKDLAGMLEHKRDTLDKIDVTLEAAMKKEKELAERILADVYGVGRTSGDENQRVAAGDIPRPGAGRSRTLER